MTDEELLNKISNGTKVIGFASEYDADKVYNLLLKLAEENKIEIQEISKNETEVTVSAKIK